MQVGGSLVKLVSPACDRLSIFGRSFRMVYYEDLNRSFFRFEFEPELFLKSGENRRPIRIEVRFGGVRR